MSIKFSQEKISKILPWIIIGIGIILRLAQYLYNRSLTEGEAPLAMNIVQRSYAELLRPLDYVQAAPVGFLFLQKFLVNLFGNNEYALRIFPLIAGIIALFLFFKVAKKIISNWSILIGLILFVTNDQLIYFASEIKQYSSDVTITLLLIFIAINIFSNNYNIINIILLGLTGAISIWFSHPSVFTFCAVVIVLSITIVHNKRWPNLIWLIIACAIWAVSLWANYLVSLKLLSQHKEFLEFWQRSFVSLVPKSLADIKWLGYCCLRIFKNPLGLSVYELLLAVFSFFVGSIVCWRKRRKIYAILMLPIVFALFASGFHKYPFEGRLLLFITPMMTLVIAEGIDFIRGKTARGSNIIAMFLVIILIFYPVMLAGYHLIKPRAPEELRQVLNYLKEHRRNNEIVYVYCGAVNAFRYYADKFGYTTNDYIAGIESRNNWTNYYKDLSKLKSNKRVWIIFSHIATWQGVDEEKLFLSYLDLFGKQLNVFRAPGASAYLYDLSN